MYIDFFNMLQPIIMTNVHVSNDDGTADIIAIPPLGKLIHSLIRSL